MVRDIRVGAPVSIANTANSLSSMPAHSAHRLPRASAYSGRFSRFSRAENSGVTKGSDMAEETFEEFLREARRRHPNAAATLSRIAWEDVREFHRRHSTGDELTLRPIGSAETSAETSDRLKAGPIAGEKSSDR